MIFVSSILYISTELFKKLIINKAKYLLKKYFIRFNKLLKKFTVVVYIILLKLYFAGWKESKQLKLNNVE